MSWLKRLAPAAAAPPPEAAGDAPAAPAGPRDAAAESDSPAIDPRDLRNALGCFATGVTVIAVAGPDGARAGLTANSFSSVSLNPPLVLWSLGSHSPSLGLFQDASHYAISVLAADQAEIALQFARPSEDKFAGVAVREGLGGAPVVEGAIATFECRNAYRYYGGDHVIFMGEVEAYSYAAGAPLLFARGAFGDFAARPKPGA